MPRQGLDEVGQFDFRADPQRLEEIALALTLTVDLPAQGWRARGITGEVGQGEGFLLIQKSL